MTNTHLIPVMDVSPKTILAFLTVFVNFGSGGLVNDFFPLQSFHVLTITQILNLFLRNYECVSNTDDVFLTVRGQK